MGIRKDYLRVVADAGVVDRVQNATSTGTVLVNYGVSRISQSGAASTFQLAAPNEVGLRKSIVVDTSTAATSLATVGAETFIGPGGAGGTLTASSAAAGTARAVELVALTTSLWGVTAQTTGITFA